MSQSEQDAARRAAMHRKRDELFTSEEAVAYDREVVAKFTPEPANPPARDVEDEVIPDVPSSEGDPTVEYFNADDHSG